MDWTAVFTGLLVLVTGGLVWVAGRQLHDARVLQRAYVSALPAAFPPQPAENCLPTWNSRMWATCLHLRSNRY